ncbi:hypothetical protein BC938DRAFT_476662 [Jimgerdemannia flammicorona]|uniref:Uncharacterized protein n=1 Tax=Jimgerdemannia flammicorona TaxID=994334 RepID=A0A433PFC0_9FUNG|nr:hypothetical protein BC938DRAFT_476662 [Jimgerdemannia flammicorona]
MENVPYHAHIRFHRCPRQHRPRGTVPSLCRTCWVHVRTPPYTGGVPIRQYGYGQRHLRRSWYSSLLQNHRCHQPHRRVHRRRRYPGGARRHHARRARDRYDRNRGTTDAGVARARDDRVREGEGEAVR